MTGSITTPKNDNLGIIPSADNYGQIGSSSKKFYRGYFNTLYENGTQLSSKYASINHTHPGNIIDCATNVTLNTFAAQSSKKTVTVSGTQYINLNDNPFGGTSLPAFAFSKYVIVLWTFSQWTPMEEHWEESTKIYTACRSDAYHPSFNIGGLKGVDLNGNDVDETENDIEKFKIVNPDRSEYKVTNNTSDVSTTTQVLYYIAYVRVIII